MGLRDELEFLDDVTRGLKTEVRVAAERAVRPVLERTAGPVEAVEHRVATLGARVRLARILRRVLFG